jgi:hypothetical protein
MFAAANDVVRAACVEVGQGGAMLANGAEAGRQIGCPGTPQPRALQAFAQRDTDRVGQRLAGQRRDFPGEAIGFLIFEAERHASLGLSRITRYV